MKVEQGAPPPEALVERFQELSAGLEQISDPIARDRAQEMIGVVLDLYGEGLRRIFETLQEAGELTEEIRHDLAGDGVVASLMLIHDLYPVGLSERVSEALDSVRPYMESHGGDVELLGIVDGVATIKLNGSCEGCPASAATLELAIKQALDEHAPDLEGLAVEGAIEDGAMPEPSGNELPIVQVSSTGESTMPQMNASGNGNGGTQIETLPSWFPIRDMQPVGEGQLVGAAVAGTPLIVANVDGSLLAYRDHCTACDSTLGASSLDDGVLSCPSCKRRYYLPRAGRSLDDEQIQLEPIPLLAEGGSVRVALST